MEKISITRWTGPVDFLDEPSSDVDQGSLSRNIEITDANRGKNNVRTRLGTRTVFTPAGRVKAIYNWIRAGINSLMRLEDDKVIQRNLSTGIDTQILTVAGPGAPSGAKFLAYGHRLFMCFWAQTSLQNQTLFGKELYVWDGSFASGLPRIEKAFPIAPAAGMSATEPAPGDVDPTTKRFGFIAETFGGGFSNPGPPSGGGIFTPMTITPSGGLNLVITITPPGTWPITINRLHLIVELDEQWYLADVEPIYVPPGGPGSVSFTFDAPDTRIATFDPIEEEGSNDFFSLISQDSSGNGPIFPYQMLDYNSRLVLFTQVVATDLINTSTALMISDAGKPQWMTFKGHLIQLPQFLPAVTGSVIRDGLYVYSPAGTFQYFDIPGALPVAWKTPTTISGSIGSPWFRGVTQNAGKTYSWVASQFGLYYFNGAGYTQEPSSKGQTNLWNRINKAAGPDKVCVFEDVPTSKVMVFCPLDNATEPNTLFVWDFSESPYADGIQFCGAWTFKRPSGAMFAPAGADTVEYNSVPEIWLYSSSPAHPVIRQHRAGTTDPTPWNDDGMGIDSVHRFGPVFPVNGWDYKISELNIWATGAGRAIIKGFERGARILGTLESLPLRTQPKGAYRRGPDWSTPYLEIEISNNAAPNAWFSLSKILIEIDEWFQSWSEG